MNLKNILNRLEFRHISLLSNVQLNKILFIRNEKNIRNNMVTKHIITQKEHIKWINSFRKSKNNFFYAVFYLDKIIGGVGIYDVNNVNKISHWAFYISSLIKINGLGAALAGLMLVSRLSSANPTQGGGLMLNAIASVFVGMTMSEEGEPNIFGTLTGVLILGVLSNGLTQIKIDTYIQQIITGGIIIGAVMFSSLTQHNGK